MRVLHDVLAVLVLTAVVGCQPTESVTLETNDQKASYGIGLGMGRQLEPAGSRVDLAAVRAGLEDAMAGNEQRVSDDDLLPVMQAFNEAVQADRQAAAEEEGRENTEAGAAYLSENGAREGVTTTASGLQYEVLREGDGSMPAATDQVTINYRGTLIDGTEFDSSYDGTPLTLGADRFIPGFSEGLQQMSVGGQYRLVIPGNIGYGPAGSPPNIGPNAILIFEVELLEIPES